MQEYRLVVKRKLLKKSVKTVVEETAVGINKLKHKDTEELSTKARCLSNEYQMVNKLLT